MALLRTKRSSVSKKGKLQSAKSLEMTGPTIQDLPSLRRKRTLAFNRLSRVLEIAELANSDESQIDLFLAHYSAVQKYVDSFEENHSDILTVLDSTSESVVDDELRAQFDTTYFQIIAFHRKLISPSSSSITASNSNSNVKLPKVQIPKFAGHIKSWPEFYDIFNSLVHSNASLSDTDRMHYLLSNISGDALALVRTFPVDGKYYHEAFQTLITRYRNKRELAFTCWKEILNVNFKINSPHDFRRVLDLFHENLSILKSLNLPVDQWDFILSYLILSKLDSKTRCEFERENPKTELPTYNILKEFLYCKCEALVRDTHFSSHDSRSQEKSAVNSKAKTSTTVFLADISESNLKQQSADSKFQAPSPSSTSLPKVFKCTFCSEGHSISRCDGFLQKPVSERIKYAKTHNWCFNCLKPSHGLRDCRSIFKCQKCQQRHHSLLHQDDKPYENDQGHVSPSVLTTLGNGSSVLLSTALVQVRDSVGNFILLRALIDSGSQAHFITDRAVERLGINRYSTSRRVRGLGQSSSDVSGAVTLEVGSNNLSRFTINALTLPSICGIMPSTRLDNSTWHHLRGLSLADPDCHKPGPIDLLLGAEIFASMLLPGSISGGLRQPSALNSVFGWILLGGVSRAEDEGQSFFIKEDDLLHVAVKRLWELDSYDTTTRLTPDEERCEEYFITQHSRDLEGRYVVTLPFKKSKPSSFPGSRDIALRCFHSIERKLLKNPDLHQQYLDFMRDYLNSGHMSLVSVGNLKHAKYFIPHHCVLRPDSASTKLRVVFNASSKDARGISLNDTLLIGPKLQTNIAEILLKFRVHFIVFTADMRQMYRMIQVAEADRDYQRIFWRFDTTQPIQEYRLNTVTYGVSSAPFLACRTIKQLIVDEGLDFPLASNILSSDVYIDDIVTGFNSFDEASQAKTQIIELLKRGHFELRKWASNTPELLTDLPSDHCLTSSVALDDKDNPTLKVLGLRWDPRSDCFFFTVTPQRKDCTKRNILSEVARVFDPLGFLSPITLVAKVLVQRLWVAGVGWDDKPSEDVVSFWDLYLKELPLLQSLQLPRCVSVNRLKSCEIHGFSDSSEVGYGAVVYLRVIDEDDNIRIFFICSKGRVAPTKSTSLPRLELCAAVLLADLLKFVIDTYLPVFPCTNVFAWSDSTIVLAWIRSHPSRWKTFVANRVSHILDVIPSARWSHVASEDNPADIVSRGQLPSVLIQNRLWWAGPLWLSHQTFAWPGPAAVLDQTALQREEKGPHTLLTHDDFPVSFIDALLERYSSIRKIQRLVCVWLRFFDFIRGKRTRCSAPVSGRKELHRALLILVKHVQSHHFALEIQQLQAKTLLSKQMRKLNPFLDPQGILRVGGRLSRSGLEFEHKYPALLPSHSKFTFMIIEAVHRENCHAGINTTQFLLTQQFWILCAKRLIRKCLSKCFQCYRTNPVSLEPFMSDLPAARVNQVKPFSVVGVDYAGPFRIKLGKHRGAKISKAYLCLFVCFTTKALHLEVASDLSSEAFIAALRRFVGRRGRVSTIHCDCGTNFVGAERQLNSFLRDAAHTEQIVFKFNPPASPHFGGVWEIQVKAVKTHLYRIVGNQCLTFEELSTLFVQIESMLNSRPLCPLSSDPNDISVLTPGHFLTLEPLTSVPDEDVKDLNINRLGRWQLVQRFQQVFWQRWRTEYLHTLTQRAKWTNTSRPLDVGAVVIIRSDNIMPLYWPIARVESLHPGPDGVVRVATVRLANGSLLTRSLTKLCPLPDQCY